LFPVSISPRALLQVRPNVGADHAALYADHARSEFLDSQDSRWNSPRGGLWKPLNSGGHLMARGTVKWFNPTKGYGFIQPQGGGKDVFVHISAVEKAGLTNLNEGQTVEYEEVTNRGKTSAENLKVQR
jgi:cold shock protein